MSGADHSFHAREVHNQRFQVNTGESAMESADARFRHGDDDTGLSFHLLAASFTDLCIYKMENINLDRPNTLSLAWQVYRKGTRGEFYAFPHFGRHPRAYSELGFSPLCNRPVAFSFTEFSGVRWPNSSLPRGPHTLTIRDPDFTSLYYMPSRDYDEGRGIGVFANGYGEVAVCDFNGSPRERLRRCFEVIVLPSCSADRGPIPQVHLRASSLASQPLLTDSQHPVPCALPPPHPYDRMPELSPDPVLFALWKEREPSHIPHGWNMDWETDAPRGVWRHFIYGCFTFAWRLENVYKILGTPIPLLQQPGALFLSAGGLVHLVIGAIEGYAERIFVLPHGTSDLELGQRTRMRPLEQGLPEVRKDGSMARYSEVDVWDLWEFDENEMQRDRVGELAARAAEMTRE
ncbi:hypothetical protein PsYK624_148700 [Phanerochaete sordida]|uniref:Uncharacterized protein n=1 Tax=Phanerochaete sordida TaxID=48140 RepID=A0A9P3LKL0_9APHY|nr:hypothetical protein PsYK624_148700 [Phanerochaete sordida]